MKTSLLRSIAPVSFALLLALSLSACSTFHREWKQAASQPTPTDDITGRWEGAWKSEVTGHEGTLRCVVSNESPEKYRFLYHATWKKVLHGSYTVLEDVKREDSVFKMHGSADLGKLYGGRYEYDGRATPTNFFSTYQAKEDHGTFEMARPHP